MAEAENKSLPDKGPVKEEIKFQYFWYLFILFTNFLASLIVPSLLFLMYVFLFFLPKFLETKSFLALFTEIKPFLAMIFMPLVIIGCYLIRLFFVSLITRGFWKLSEKKSPSREGIIPRNFPSKVLNFYHIRGFLMKYGKNSFVKGIFPWLSNWFYNFVGASVIGKGSTIEESVSNDKFIEVGENCYIGVNSALASHVIEGIFGNISYFKVKAGDNVTAAAMNIAGPGSEIKKDSYLLPLASTPKHSVIKGKNYYWGIPLRKIFRKKIMNYLRITPKDLERNENVEGFKDKKILRKLKTRIPSKQLDAHSEVEQETEEKLNQNVNPNSISKEDLRIDFTTSSAISRVNIKFLAVYIPIFWLSGMLDTVIFYTFTSYVQNWVLMAFFLPLMVIIMWLVFILGCFFFSKLLLILINLIHKPKEGIFPIPSTDFEFWCLRTELKKIVLWLMRNWPLPWIDILAFKWFGIKMSLSTTLYDSWTDAEFIRFGRRVIIGQGATVMSSMVIGKYLIIKEVIFDDYVMIGGQAIVSPGTIIGNDSIVGALSTTTYDQVLEPGWIYFGIPVIKLKKNKYAEERRDILMKKDVDEEEKYVIEYEVNIEED
jgi:acetyltransferase-like isoleucine patch superfamily enzyme